jgi:ADP-dependent NAD(P)H-hydrate dehydratase / NAD(P)H-hydrate epimerase
MSHVADNPHGGLVMKVSNVSQMRSLDTRAIEEFGIKEELLMENAGDAVYVVLSEEIGIAGKRFVVLCGGGNNGGDGFVVARKIHSVGGAVKVFLLGNPKSYRGAAKLNLGIITRLPIEVRRIDSAESVRQDLNHCDAIVDAIFGTGLARNVEGLYREVIDMVNNSGKTVVSADIPSGVQGDTGKVMGTAVKADYTITFGLPKIGNMLYPGYGLCGKLYVTHISFPPSMVDTDDLKVRVNRPLHIPPRNPEGHKGAFGDMLFVAGASGYLGAPYFAALSFMKAGGGYARLAAPASITPFIANAGPEIVFVPQQETASGSIGMENLDALLAVAEKVDMVVLGPGLSLDQETQQLTRELVRRVEKPLLLDGDGITALCPDLDIIKGRRSQTILTPHLGEMSRITNRPVPDIDADKIAILQQAAKDLNAAVVLKGPHSLIGYPDGKVWINLTGNPGMATAGAGDVLTGAIAAMFGLGLCPEEAVRTGVFVHGFSGDLAAETKGEDGITAQDILDFLPLATRKMRESRDEVPCRRYDGPIVL